VGVKRQWCSHRGKVDTLNFSQFVEGRKWYPCARDGIAETSVFAGDEPCRAEAIRYATARF